MRFDEVAYEAHLEMMADEAPACSSCEDEGCPACEEDPDRDYDKWKDERNER